MAVEFVTSFNMSSNSEGSSLSTTVTVASPVNCLIVFSSNTSNTDTNNCTWQGLTFTKFSTILKPTNTGRSSAWVLMNPPTGSGEISLTWSSGVPYRAAKVMAFSGVGELLANTPRAFKFAGSQNVALGVQDKPGMLASSVSWYSSEKYTSVIGAGTWAGDVNSDYAKIGNFYRSFDNGANITVTINSSENYSYSFTSAFLYPIGAGLLQSAMY